jgi:transcriptional regulator with GAF, ATPase, and Fis domain
LLDNLKKSDATVLIQGESGTGKELVARTIHHGGLRKKAAFVAINCGAIPQSLMESELFGHERGAFTSAVHQRKGKFEVADGGTLFLDEIGELEKDLQVKLLRVLQEREFMRVGGNTTHKTNVRIIAATSQDLRTAVAEGYFRDDLYYRLNVVPVNVPPLRERPEDIPLLLDYFVKKYAGETGLRRPLITSEAREAIYNYRYPGNVRELMNIVERLFVLCTSDSVTVENLPAELLPETTGSQDNGSILRRLPPNGIRLETVERELILKTIDLTGGNKTAAAKVLGITRRRLYLRLSRYQDVVPEATPRVTQRLQTVT